MTDPRTPTSDPVAALDAAWEALIADAVGSFNPSSVIRRHRPIIEAEARQQARAAFAAQDHAAVMDAIEVSLQVSGYTASPRLARAAHAAASAVLAASPEPASPEASGSGLGVERLARALESVEVPWVTVRTIDGWVENHADFVAWSAAIVAEYHRLAARPDGAEADTGHSPWRDMAPEQWDKAGRK